MGKIFRKNIRYEIYLLVIKNLHIIYRMDIKIIFVEIFYMLRFHLYTASYISTSQYNIL